MWRMGQMSRGNNARDCGFAPALENDAVLANEDHGVKPLIPMAHGVKDQNGSQIGLHSGCTI